MVKVTREQREAMGYKADRVIETAEEGARAAAHADASWAATSDAIANLDAGKAARSR